MPEQSNYDAVNYWDRFIFEVAHGVDPVTAFNDMVGQASDRLVSDHRAVWDDLRFPAQAINPPGQPSDPDRESTSGLFLFAANGIELIYAFVQMPHTWLEGSDIVPHVHWTKTTSASGNVAWNLKYKKFYIGLQGDANWTDLGVVSSSVPGTPDTDTIREHLISSWGEQTILSDGTISDCLLFEISRLGGDAADTYGSDARLLEFDVHFQLDSAGSVFQFEKDN